MGWAGAPAGTHLLMRFLVQSKGAEGTIVREVVEGLEDAIAKARDFVGLVEVDDLDSRRWWVYRDGLLLEGAEANEAHLGFEGPGPDTSPGPE